MLCKKVLPTFVRAGCNCNKIIWRRWCCCCCCCFCYCNLFCFWFDSVQLAHTHVHPCVCVCVSALVSICICVYFILLFFLSCGQRVGWPLSNTGKARATPTFMENVKTSKQVRKRQAGICSREIPRMDKDESHFSWCFALNSAGVLQVKRSNLRLDVESCNDPGLMEIEICHLANELGSWGIKWTSLDSNDRSSAVTFTITNTQHTHFCTAITGYKNKELQWQARLIPVALECNLLCWLYAQYLLPTFICLCILPA